jgi:HAD superfamily phosphoserine phosphatase-like hydrolase
MTVALNTSDVAIICDFDGTIILEDTGELAMERFATGDFEYYDKLLIEGKISLRECIETQYGMIVANEEEMLVHLMPHTQFREGFPMFAANAASRGIDMTVVSAGIEFIIHRKLGSDPRTSWLPVICPKLWFADGEMHVDASVIDRKGHGEFKAAKVAEKKEAGKRVIYIGDGLSDISGAAGADQIFAVENRRLARTYAQDDRCTVFHDFYEVFQFIF